MSRFVKAVLTLLSCVILLSACDQNEPPEETDERIEGLEETTQASDSTAATDLARFQTQILRFRSQSVLVECTCSLERMGFESTEDCKARIGVWEEEVLNSYEECVTGVFAEAEEPPASTVSLNECFLEANQPVSDCFIRLHNEHDDLCTEEATALYEECTELINSRMEGCMEQIEETMGQDDALAEHEAWSESVYDKANACLDAMLD